MRCRCSCYRKAVAASAVSVAVSRKTLTNNNEQRPQTAVYKAVRCYVPVKCDTANLTAISQAQLTVPKLYQTQTWWLCLRSVAALQAAVACADGADAGKTWAEASVLGLRAPTVHCLAGLPTQQSQIDATADDHKSSMAGVTMIRASDESEDRLEKHSTAAPINHDEHADGHRVQLQ